MDLSVIVLPASTFFNLQEKKGGFLMKFRLFKIISLVLVVFMSMALVSGCGGSKSGGDKDGATTKAGTTKAATTTKKSETTIDKSPTLVVLKWLNGFVQNHYDDYGDTEFAKEREKLTGIKVEYINALGQEEMTVLISSGEYCDIYDFSVGTYPGGAAGMYSDGLILALNDVKDYAPNYFSYLEANPDVDKQLKSSEGLYYTFTYIMEDPLANYGCLVRKDWLDDVGLDIPETIDEWYEVLKAFRDEKGAAAPLTFAYPNELIYGGGVGTDTARAWVNGFNTCNSFYVDGGTVVYGPIQPGYKDFIATLSKWFAEDLIDKDLTSLNRTIQNNNITSGKSGATCNWDSYIHTYNSGGKQLDPNYNLVPAPIPVKNKGDVPFMATRKLVYDPAGVAMTISAKSKYKELATMYADWNFGEEGSILNNWGIEGESFEVGADGAYKYSNIMFNSPDGWSLGEMEAKYNSNFGPNAYISTIKSRIARAPEEYADLYQRAYEIWLSPRFDELRPPSLEVTGLTSDEISRANSIMNEINTVREEYIYRFILGDLPVNDANFNEYVNQLKALGLEEALSIYQKGYNLYNSK